MTITYKREPGAPLTLEQIQRLDALKNRPIVFDEDCPELSDEQLKQFKRITPRNPKTAAVS